MLRRIRLEERDVLARLSQAKWDLWLASGKLEMLEPGRWRLHSVSR